MRYRKLPGKRYGCLFCEHRFRWNRDLEAHTNLHTRERPYFCDQCDATFSSCSTLGGHKKVVHLGFKVRCNLCSQTFSCSGNLNQHIWRVHKVKKSRNFKRSIVCKSGARNLNAKKYPTKIRKVQKRLAKPEFKQEFFPDDFKQEVPDPTLNLEKKPFVPTNVLDLTRQSLLQIQQELQTPNPNWTSFFLHMNRYNPEDSIFSNTFKERAAKSIIQPTKKLVKPVSKRKLVKKAKEPEIKITTEDGALPSVACSEENENMVVVKQEAIPVDEVIRIEGDSVNCPYCFKVMTFNNLRPHLLVHTGEKPFACQFCTLRFRQKSHMIKHIVRYHRYRRNLGIPGKRRTVENIVEEVGDISCAFCGDLFNATAFLEQHLLREHNDHLQAENT